MIETIVSSINTIFKAAITGVPIQVYGIAEPIIKRELDEENEIETLMPMIVDEYGEMQYPFVDDDYKLGWYHKLNSKKYDVNQKTGVGDAAKVVVTASMSLICWGFGIKNEATEEFFAAKKPEIMVFTDTVFDRNSVFSGEFKGVDFFLPPEVSLIKINYTVRYIQKAECIEINDIFNQ